MCIVSVVTAAIRARSKSCRYAGLLWRHILQNGGVAIGVLCLAHARAPVKIDVRELNVSKRAFVGGNCGARTTLVCKRI